MSTLVIRQADSAERQFYIVEVADNGEPINTSEMYPSKSNAMRAARARADEYTDMPEIVDLTTLPGDTGQANPPS